MRIILAVIWMAFSLFSYAQGQTSQKESIKDIIAKAKELGSVQYEVVIVYPPIMSPFNKVTTKAWQKSPYFKLVLLLEGNTKRTDEIIAHPETLYVYFHSEGKYRKNPVTKEVWSLTPIGEFLYSFKKSMTIEELGTEVVDGKLTTIIEFDYSARGVLCKRKSWVWNEKGIPLKEEIVSAKGSSNSTFTTKMEYKNFIFQDIPISFFEVPEDKIIK